LKVTHEYDIVFLIVTSCISVLVSCNDVKCSSIYVIALSISHSF